ncbi:hypothetical protein P7C70_g3728, partial [Phenoliferia sp. Uapishka_3]
PALVFLGVDERSAPLSAKSLPLSKPTDESTLESHSPYGIPYWALDVTTLDDLRSKVLKDGGGEFTDMRAGMASISPEQASLAGEGRALVDWNTRNRLEDARYFTRAEILEVLAAESNPLTKEEVTRFDLQQAQEQGKNIEGVEKKIEKIRLPASTAIAHTLVKAWASNEYLQGSKL